MGPESEAHRDYQSYGLRPSITLISGIYIKVGTLPEKLRILSQGALTFIIGAPGRWGRTLANLQPSAYFPNRQLRLTLIISLSTTPRIAFDRDAACFPNRRRPCHRYFRQDPGGDANHGRLVAGAMAKASVVGHDYLKTAQTLARIRRASRHKQHTEASLKG